MRLSTIVLLVLVAACADLPAITHETHDAAGAPATAALTIPGFPGCLANDTIGPAYTGGQSLRSAALYYAAVSANRSANAYEIRNQADGQIAWPNSSNTSASIFWVKDSFTWDNPTTVNGQAVRYVNWNVRTCDGSKRALCNNPSGRDPAFFTDNVRRFSALVYDRGDRDQRVPNTSVYWKRITTTGTTCVTPDGTRAQCSAIPETYGGALCLTD